jgi:hypothetical protein
VPAETAPTRPPSDPSTHGRVDEDGNVYVRTADGERLVGAYPGATAEEALAYFGRKYDDLAAQVDLLDVRVRTTDLTPKDALTSITRLRETVTTAAVVGDLEALAAHLDALVEVVEQRRVAQDAARAKAREQARATKERIVAEAESLAASTQWKATGDRLRTLLDEWKAAPRLERRADDELWKRFSAARTTFDRARRQHFATLDASATKRAYARSASFSRPRGWPPRPTGRRPPSACVIS